MVGGLAFGELKILPRRLFCPTTCSDCFSWKSYYWIGGWGRLGGVIQSVVLIWFSLIIVSRLFNSFLCLLLPFLLQYFVFLAFRLKEYRGFGLYIYCYASCWNSVALWFSSLSLVSVWPCSEEADRWAPYKITTFLLLKKLWWKDALVKYVSTHCNLLCMVKYIEV